MARAQATPSSGIATTLDAEQLRRGHRFTRTVICKLDVMLEDIATPAFKLHVPIVLQIGKEIELRPLEATIQASLATDELNDDFAAPKNVT